MYQDIEDSILDSLLEDAAASGRHKRTAEPPEATSGTDEGTHFNAGLADIGIPELIREIYTEDGQILTDEMVDELLNCDSDADTLYKGMKLEVDEDGMTARICLLPSAKASLPTEEDIFQFLEDMGITHGVRNNFPSRLLRNPVFNKSFIIAQGTPPVDGTEPVLKYYFDTTKAAAPLKLNNGQVDFKELGLIHLVEEGDLLCEQILGEPGYDGCNVYGETVNAKFSRPKPLEAGVNVQLSADRSKVYAACCGEVTLQYGKISVNKVLHVDNVDASTGNIKFLGSVYVAHRVCTGFSVQATQNITVGEIVEGADLSAGGDIMISQGIKGSYVGKIRADGSLWTGFIENANLQIGNSIFADTLLSSNTVCGGKISLVSQHGCLVGGSCLAHQYDLVQLGNDSNTATSVSVSMGRDLKKQVQELDKKQSECTLAAQKLEKLSRAMKSSSADEEKKVLVQQELMRTNIEKNKCRKESSQLREKLEQLEKEFSFDIKVRDTLYPNVRVNIENTAYVNKERTVGCVLFLAVNQIYKRFI